MSKGIQRLADAKATSMLSDAVARMTQTLTSMQSETTRAIEGIDLKAPEVDAAAIGAAVGEAVGSQLGKMQPPEIKLDMPKGGKKDKPVSYKLKVQRDSRGNLTEATFEPVV